ncbi:hypothetical protein vseg_019443 [Gypsophila vaccaria]
MASIGSSRSSKSVPSSCENFGEFFSAWLERQRAYLDKLVDASSGGASTLSTGEKGELVERVLAHYEEYYEEKYSSVMGGDVFQLFSPPWLTTFEKAFLWIGGLFKPSLVLGMADDSIDASAVDMGQAERLEAVKDEVEWMEKKLMDGLAEVQESIGSRTLTELTKNWRKLVDGEVSDFEDAVVELKDSLMKVVMEADNLRTYAVAKVVEILNLDQTIKLLIAIAQFQLRVRSWGVRNDNEFQRGQSSVLKP